MIIGVDLNDDKEEWGRKFGMTHFINPKNLAEGTSVVQAIVDLTKTAFDNIGGADYSFDCTGNVKVMRDALECTHRGWGQSIIIGVAPALRWELIGHLQSNKAKLAATHFARIQSVDSEKLLAALNRAAGELGKKLPVLLQINAGHDPAKFGIEPADAPRLLECAMAQTHLQVDGLMTVAPLADDADIAQRTFANLRNIRDELATRFGTPLRELSMGRSGDLASAIAEGSTVVRVGSALYGPRE